MPAQNPLHSLNLVQYAHRFRDEMIPLGNRFCYFCASVSLTEDDLREYLDEPVAALPPVIAARLPEVRILLVPYLENGAREGARNGMRAVVATEKPQDSRSLAFGASQLGSSAVFAFAVKDAEVADYHYRLYHAIAELVAGKTGTGVPPAFSALLHEELAGGSHGEVDELAWRLKAELDDKDRSSRVSTRRFKAYARQSFIDTLTLYMHGICCDIDIETGPRQLPSNLLRKRLKLLRDTYPPPPGYAVLPEDL